MLNLKKLLLTKLLSEAPSVFLRGNDKISTMPLLGYGYECEVQETIVHFVEKNYSNFLIDVGANVGLTSISVGNRFKNIWCFEPNKLAFNVLKANLSAAGLLDKTNIEEFGLGEREGKFELRSLISNLGGAFVVGPDQGYSDSILAKKDNMQSIGDQAYSSTEVEIRNTEKTLIPIFTSLLSKGEVSGVIKVDTEGMEKVIIQGIGKSLPREFNCVIIFENHDPGLEMSSLLDCFTLHEKKCFHILKEKPFRPKTAKFIKVLKSFFGIEETSLVECDNYRVPTGNLFIALSSSNS